ncbi:MAG: type II toxin-antitoxin system VapC family toxin [Blastocatellia bacterium]
MSSLLIDSDGLIDYLRGQPSAVSFIEGVTEPMLISAVSVAELYAGVRALRRKPVESDHDEEARLKSFLDAFELVTVDASVAEKGGFYRRDYGRSHGTGLADSPIAASAGSRLYGSHPSLLARSKQPRAAQSRLNGDRSL